MSDIVCREVRRRMMSGIRSKNTKPEITVRKWLHAHGYRFRLHKKELPGKPDIVLPKYNTVIFVHGCFWHRHENCKYATTPGTNSEWWADKFQKNVKHDADVFEKLESIGYNILVIWECEVKNRSFIDKIEKFFNTIKEQ